MLILIHVADVNVDRSQGYGIGTHRAGKVAKSTCNGYACLPPQKNRKTKRQEKEYPCTVPKNDMALCFSFRWRLG